MAAIRKLNRKRVVLEAMGWGNSKFYQNIKDGLFVGPVKIGLRASAWPSDEVSVLQDAYIAGKSAKEIRALVEKLEAARGNVRKESVNETENSETVKLSIEPCVGNRPFATTCPVSPGTHGEFRMNYYPHHIGDYRRDTSQLTLLEHGVYRQLLDTYYLSEQPIPKDLELVFRKLSAKSEDERKVVEAILIEFFVSSDEGWIHTRCNKEIREYQGKAGRAMVNGKRGGRPKKTEVVISRLSNKTQEKANQEPLTINQELLTINQEPLTRNQEPLKPSVKHTEVTDPPDVLERNQACVDVPPAIKNILQPGTAESCCKAMVEQGVQGCNPHHPVLIALMEAGATEQEFAHAARHAIDKGNHRFAYVIGTVKRQREDALKLMLHRGRMPNKQEALEASNRAATEGWVPPEMRNKNHEP